MLMDTTLRWIKTLLFTLLLASTLACRTPNAVSNHPHIPYDLSKYRQRIELPTELNEVSGIAMLDSNTLLCIQDEDGIIFQFSIPEQKITNRYPFAEAGDYEGIALLGDTAYVLRSDGVLFEVCHFNQSQRQVNKYPLPSPAKNHEGMAYDPATHSFLIAPKGPSEKGKASKNIRHILRYNLMTKQLDTSPAYTLNLDEIWSYIEAHEVEVPYKKKSKKEQDQPIVHFRISSLEIHPITGQLYMLSESDKLLLVYNDTGKLEYVELLDRNDFQKAEGMCFSKQGDLYISNEAKGEQPTLLRYAYHH